MYAIFNQLSETQVQKYCKNNKKRGLMLNCHIYLCLYIRIQAYGLGPFSS